MTGSPGTGGLLHELDRWASAGLTAEIWWRDDDLQRPTPALEPLLAMADAAGWAPGLAVVPEGADTDALTSRLAGTGAEFLVHGFAHRNHAAADEKKCEFPASRPLPDRCRDAREGLIRLREAFPDRLLSCFVPPWNRIAPDLVERLCESGFTGLSTFGPRPASMAAPGLRRVNTHIDVIDWRGTRKFVGTDTVATALASHLEARRMGRADAEEPSGLLTHHLVMVDEDWRALEALVLELKSHEAVSLIAPRDCFCL
ncbi:polysaccharide deacetylase family protein [Nisaea nitritireducens]|uniref:polysaccharide deacetylase family protein n=1 Tax=Nisaea nitritireducens TaxID=568392 RepID=UPI0018664C4D|nr:polysaccharide deacetylase family protein [Nisaea nitritireducens]